LACHAPATSTGRCIPNASLGSLPYRLGPRGRGRAPVVPPYHDACAARAVGEARSPRDGSAAPGLNSQTFGDKRSELMKAQLWPQKRLLNRSSSCASVLSGWCGRHCARLGAPGSLLEPAEDPVHHVQRTGAAVLGTLTAPVLMLQQRRWATWGQTTITWFLGHLLQRGSQGLLDTEKSHQNSPFGTKVACWPASFPILQREIVRQMVK